MHDLPLLTTIATAFFFAWILGLVTHRLGLSPIVGYLCAGIVIGPHTPGYIGDVHIAQQLAEVGVILLMFGVGLHFHFKDLYRVKWIAIPGAVGQSLVATFLGIIAFTALGLEFKAGLVLGMAMAVASTVVLIRVLEDNEKLNTRSGHAAIGWLIVEDIFTIVALVALPILGARSGLDSQQTVNMWSALGLAFLKLGALVVLVVLAGFRLVPQLMVHVAKLRSRELFTLTVLVLSIGVAAGSSAFFGVSLALGAFLGGMVVGQSPVSYQAASDALPLRDAFAVLFFVSVGMLFDYTAIINQPLMVLAALGIVLIAKPLAALIIVAVLGHPFRTGIVVSLGLAQVGEFSFILSEVARKQGLMPEVGHSVLVATAILSISLNPLIFRLRNPMEQAVKKHVWLWKLLNGRAQRRFGSQNAAAVEIVSALPVEEKRRTAIVIGYGHVGQGICRLLQKSGLRTVVIDANMETVAKLRENAEEGCFAIFGDARSASVLEDAGVREARYLLVTMAQSSNPLPVIAQARQLNPSLRILVRSRYLGEQEALVRAGATETVFEEAEVAKAMGRLVRNELGDTNDEFEREMDRIRETTVRRSDRDASQSGEAARAAPPDGSRACRRGGATGPD